MSRRVCHAAKCRREVPEHRRAVRGPEAPARRTYAAGDARPAQPAPSTSAATEADPTGSGSDSATDLHPPATRDPSGDHRRRDPGDDPAVGLRWPPSSSTPRTSPARCTRCGTARSTPPALVPSVMVVWVFVLLVLALIGRLWLSLGIVTALTALLGAVNADQARAAQRPAGPQRRRVPRPARASCSTWSRSRKLVDGRARPGRRRRCSPWGFGWLVGKLLPTPVAAAARGAALHRAAHRPRASWCSLCLALLGLASNFNEHGNPWRAAFDSTGLRWRAWDQRVNYQRNGFVAGLLYNTHVTAMAKPEGYSKAGGRGDRPALPAPRPRSSTRAAPRTLDKTNVVIILSESFSQPAWLKTVKFPQDLIPKTTADHAADRVGQDAGARLRQRHGQHGVRAAHRPVAEPALPAALDRPTSSWSRTTRRTPRRSSYFRDHGHTPIAIHPFSPRMYARTQVFKTFGFDKFITKDDDDLRRPAGAGASSTTSRRSTRSSTRSTATTSRCWPT